MKNLLNNLFCKSVESDLGVLIEASKNTLGTAGGAIMEVTAWVYKH